MIGTITLDGQKFTVEARNGVRYIEGIEIEEWLETKATARQLIDLTRIGIQELRAMLSDTEPDSPQGTATKLHQERNN